ncbi:MAG TPA: helix-turn-helix transcriptional regulator [Streptosporangiaceae bacterium]|nr:helix-turn-helix transcriptional regulator [Streptosporangiaceae bacterium]
MTIPPSKPGNTARAALAARLTRMREAAGLSGNALAKRMGIVQSRVWKIEHGALLPTDEDVRAWARETGNEQEAERLMEALAEARGEQAFSAVIRTRGGAAFEDQVRRVEERATRIGEFQVAFIPGTLQTADYARELLSVPSGLRTWDSDENAVENKVNARLRRQEILHDPAKRVQVMLGEAALRTLIVPAPVLVAQLGKLLSVLRLPSVELGVIGFGQKMPVYPLGFRLYDNEMAVTESIVGEHNYTADSDPDEVAAFTEAFNELRQAASTGDEAEAIIRRALDDLRHP